MLTKKAFMTGMIYLKLLRSSEKYSNATGHVFYELIMDQFTDEQFIETCRACAKDEVFFPSPADLFRIRRCIFPAPQRFIQTPGDRYLTEPDIKN